MIDADNSSELQLIKNILINSQINEKYCFEIMICAEIMEPYSFEKEIESKLHLLDI